jgi:hypothetical protein
VHGGFRFEILTGYVGGSKTVVVHVDADNSIPIIKMGEGLFL